MLVSHAPLFLLSGSPLPCGNLADGSRHKFLKAEDDLLIRLVQQFGDKNWAMIAQYMKRRTARQCRERYKNYLAPTVNHRPWSEEEDELLARQVAQYGQKWSKIAAVFEGRSDVNVKNRWSALLQRNARLEKYLLTKREKQPEYASIFEAILAGKGMDEDWDWASLPQAGNQNQF
jgi:hypothetical protein